MSKAKARIRGIQVKLNNAESTDFKYMNEAVKQLRHYVLYLHTTFESSIDKRIIQHVLKDANFSAQETQKKVSTGRNIGMLLNEMDFAKKLKIIEKQKIVTPKVIKKLFAVNDIRVYFAHPTSYRAKLISYQEDKNLLIAYETLSEALDSLKEAGIEDRPLVFYAKSLSKRSGVKK